MTIFIALVLFSSSFSSQKLQLALFFYVTCPDKIIPKNVFLTTFLFLAFGLLVKHIYHDKALLWFVDWLIHLLVSLLAALSSSRSLLVGPSVRLLVGWLVSPSTFVKM